MGQQGAPLILEILKEEEAMMRDEQGRMRDPTNEIKSLQRRKKLIKKNTEKLHRTK